MTVERRATFEQSIQETQGMTQRIGIIRLTRVSMVEGGFFHTKQFPAPFETTFRMGILEGGMNNSLMVVQGCKFTTETWS